LCWTHWQQKLHCSLHIALISQPYIGLTSKYSYLPGKRRICRRQQLLYAAHKVLLTFFVDLRTRCVGGSTWCVRSAGRRGCDLKLAAHWPCAEPLMLTNAVLVTCKPMMQVQGQACRGWVMAGRLDCWCGCPEPRLCKPDQHCAVTAGKK
jgi:hypothetical protein